MMMNRAARFDGVVATAVHKSNRTSDRNVMQLVLVRVLRV